MILLIYLCLVQIHHQQVSSSNILLLNKITIILSNKKIQVALYTKRMNRIKQIMDQVVNLVMKKSRKLAIVTIMLLFTIRAMAPTAKSLTIPISCPIEPYKELIHAIGMVETKWDSLAYNPVEQAVGVFQIRPIRLKDYNKRTGNNYKMKDLYSTTISRKIFLYYASQYGPGDLERIARNWNGSGIRTYYYWAQVKKQLGSS